MASAPDAQVHPVHYGDTISLYCDDGPGFVYTQVTSSAHVSVAVSVQRDRDMKNPAAVHETNPGLKNVHVVTFQILYPNKFKAQKRLLKMKEKMKEKYGSAPKSHLTSRELEELVQAEKKYVAEKDDNEQEQNRQRGRHLEYGQVVELLHTYTNQFLSVSTTATSQLEPSNMQMKLSSFGIKQSRFKVLPRYKVRSIGDKVMIGDQVQLESVKSEGQFLHCSRFLYRDKKSIEGPISTEEGSKELNLSATQSALTIMSHYSPQKDNPSNAVKAGSIIRLFHREVEAYLVAEGSFIEAEPVENVHLRLRPADQDRPRSLFPSTSAITYWQIELEKSSVTGEIIKWEQRCRLRHVCTRKYLCLTKEENSVTPVTSIDVHYTLSLTDDPGLSTVFRLFSVIQEVNAVCYDTYCRIEHPQSKQWLHALTDDYEKESMKATEKGKTSMEQLEWDGAKLKQIGSSDVMNYDDAFTIQEVEKEHVDILNHTAGMIPVIRQYIKDREEGRRALTRKTASRLDKGLRELGAFQIEKGEPVKARQKLLRNLRIIDLLVELLKLPRAKQEKEYQNHVLVCQAAYHVLEQYLVGNSRKNELYVAKYIPFFQGQIGQGLKAETMVMELVRDNRKIVDRVEESQIDRFVNFLTESRDYRFLDFLGVLCVCDGIAIPTNQNYVTKKLLQENQSVVYLTECGDSLSPARDPQMVYVSEDSGKIWTPLAQFAKGQEKNPSPRYLFLERQLDLFNQLCHGRNEYAINVITKELKYLTWKEAFLCLRSKELPNHLRAKYCNVIIGMFINVGENRSVLDKLCLSYVFNKVEAKPYSSAADDPKEAITGARMDFFPNIRDWIGKFLDENGNMKASEKGHNQLLTEVLRLLHYLVGYGYYANVDDIQRLLKPMLSVMDGRNDEPSPHAQDKALEDYRQTTRFVQSENNKEVVNAKHMAMEVIDLLFNFRFNIRLERFIYEFRRVSSGRDSAPLRPVLEPPTQLRRLLRMPSTRMHRLTGTEYAALVKSEAECKVLDDDHLATFARTQLEAILDESSFFENRELDLILKDLSRYQYDKMVIASMRLMSRYFSANSTLFDRAVQAQVLVHEKSIDTFHYIEKTLPVLRRLAAAKMTHEQELKMGEILDAYSRKCWIQSADGESAFESHKMNQTILYNFGILADIFDILEKEIDIDRKEYEGLREVFRKCFSLLQALARGNAVVQQRLYSRLDRLLTIRGAEAQMANALAEVFTGNQEMCMRIRNYQVQKIVGLLALHQQDASEFLDLLNAVVKIEELDLPLKRNQGFVMIAINQQRSKVCGILESSEAETRKSLLEEGDMSSPKLNYLLRLVDLLATCAEGENRFIESMCQNIFSIPELFEVLLNPDIIVACKRPYLRFFIWVYLNTASGQVESGAGDMDHDPDMWKFLDLVSRALGEIKTGLQGISQDVSKVRAMQKSLRLGPRSRTSATSERPKKMLRKQSTTSRILDEGFLSYFFDGVLPLLQVFYSDYFRSDPDNLDHRHEIGTSRVLADTLLGISSEIAQYVANKAQHRLMRRTVTAVLAQPALNLPDDKVAQFDMGGFGDRTMDVKSPALKQYEREHRSEEKLNYELNNFAINFKRAYQKRNMIRDQINVPIDEQYCEDEDDDEPLPLGKEFQDHVKAFCKHGTVVDPNGEKLVEQLCISYSSHELRTMSETERLQLERLSIRSLQVLRAIIHNQIVQVPELKEGFEVPKSYKVAMDSVETVQKSLNSFGAALKIIPLLSHHNDDIVRETLAFLSSLIYRGNPQVQNSFEDYFLHTREERFFIDIQGRLKRSAVATRERRALLSQHKAKVEKSKKMAETLRERTQGKTTGEKMGYAAMGKAEDEIEMEEIAMKAGVAADEVKGEPSPDHLRFRDDGYIEIVLRIMGYMCDGHHRVLQDYLREQPDNIKSLNLVSEVCTYLHLFYNAIDEDNIPLVIQLFNTLVEFASGNQDNQATLFDHQIIDMINDVMRMEMTRFADSDHVDDAYDLKQSAMDLLSAMVERNDDKTKRLAKEILETIHIDALYESMTTFQTVAEETPGDEGEAARRLAFTIEHVLKRFRDFGGVLYGKKWKFRHKISQEETVAEKELDNKTMSVEILDGDELHKVYFRVKDQSALREEVKETLKWNISRDSPTDKLRDFLEWGRDIQKDIQYQKKVRSHWLASLFVLGNSFWYWMVLLLTLALNVFVLSTWNAPENLFQHRPHVETSYFYPVLYSLGGLHLFFSLCMLITFYIANAHNFVLPSFLYSLLRKKRPEDSHSSINILGLRSLFYLLFVAASVLSLFFDGFFYCFHLFIIIVNNDILLRVLQSVTRNGVSLLWVAAMMLIIIYVYSVVAFAFLRQSFDRNEGLYCENLGQCFVTSLKFGLLSGGGLGEALAPKTYSFFEPGLRIFFDLSYFIVITIIALNIVFGIIVDTFSELRDDKWKAQNDMASVCFICGNPSFEFEKRGNGFEHHVKNEHNMWAYLFYFIHLSEKLHNDYTSIESHVAEKLKKDEIDFFPLNKAICLSDTEDASIEQIQELKNMIQQLLDRHQREDANLRRRQERHEQALWERRQGLARGLTVGTSVDDDDDNEVTTI
ncbi:inositol 1,4,5-trisphosphate receptor type 3-like isoform X2 [Oscarella lobularis]|uniref:inositol 1,4,5-trisphosphate receptor type 3-like isoform X2 n=1 Tax=Oscarella lobularis TaxID=121494 RepID=UPI003313CA4D